MRLGALSISTSNKRLITCIIKLTSEKSEWIFLRTDIPNFISKSINSRKHDSYCLAVSPLFPRINVSLLINAGPRFTHTAEQKKKRVGLERGLILLSSRSSSSTRGYTFTNDFWTGKKEQGLFFGSIYICVYIIYPA